MVTQGNEHKIVTTTLESGMRTARQENPSNIPRICGSLGGQRILVTTVCALSQPEKGPH